MNTFEKLEQLSALAKKRAKSCVKGCWKPKLRKILWILSAARRGKLALICPSENCLP